jgi:hypothetical protein
MTAADDELAAINVAIRLGGRPTIPSGAIVSWCWFGRCCVGTIRRGVADQKGVVEVDVCVGVVVGGVFEVPTMVQHIEISRLTVERIPSDHSVIEAV